MGIFDLFTGDPAKKAAEENRGNLTALLNNGTSIYSRGHGDAKGALDSAIGGFQPLSDLATNYGAGSRLYLDALGVNGPGGNERATAAFTTSPGYQFNLDQGLEALNRRRAAGGMLNSGNADADAIRYGSGLASGEYTNWLQNLGGVNNNALTATNAAATGKAGVYGGLAGLAQQNAGNLVNLNSSVTNGINSQNTQQANAEMAASGNLWNFGLNLAKLGTGFAGGGLGGGLGLGSGSTAMTTGRLY